MESEFSDKLSEKRSLYSAFSSKIVAYGGGRPCIVTGSDFPLI